MKGGRLRAAAEGLVIAFVIAPLPGAAAEECVSATFS